jgi:RND family efflux transporter MFP subunit
MPSKLIARLRAPLIVVGTTAAVLFLMVAFRPESPVRPQEAEPVTLIEVAPVMVGDHAVQLPSQGMIRSRTSSTLAAQVAGNITAISEQLRRGGTFNKGDWLLSIDDRDYVAAVRLAEANLQNAEVGIMEEKARADQAIRDWDRLGDGKEANDLVLRKPQLAAAQSSLQAMQAQLSKAQLDLERTQVTAPYGGRVVMQSADIGDYVTPGKLLADLVGTDTLEVDLPISAQWRGLVNWEDRIPVTLSVSVNNQVHSWYGQVMRASADIDSASRQFSLIAEVSPEQIDPNSPQLLIGDYVEASIIGRTLANVAVIPRQALVDGDFVWRVEDSRLYKRPVNVIWKDQHVAIVASGLENGDLVNVTPLGYMVSGGLIEIINDTNSEEDKSGMLGALPTAEDTDGSTNKQSIESASDAGVQG